MVGKVIFLLLLISLAYSFQLLEGKPTESPTSTTLQTQTQKTLNSGNSLGKDSVPLPDHSENENENENGGFTEVNEDDIPEGVVVYVMEEPEDNSADGEILETANNIVFRPLFRYRSKQEAQRRSHNRIRRRYFIPSSYQKMYRYPYYSQRY